MIRRRLGAVVTAFAVAAAPGVLAAPAADAASYRYWSYWTVTDAAWKFAQVGPTTLRPKDGDVQGWRFAVTTDSTSAARPRLAPSTAFDDVCGSTARPDGQKRVALVVDFGTAADASSGDEPPSDPLRGECVVTGTAADGWDVLVTAGYAIRSDDGGLICGLAGYPAKGCGEAVVDPPKTSEPGSGSGSGGSGGSSAGSGSSASAGDSGGKKKDRAADRSSEGDSGTASLGGRDRDTAPTTTATADATDAATEESAESTTEPSSDVPAPEGTQDGEPTPTLVPGVAEPVAASGDGPGGALGTALGALVLVGLIGAAAFTAVRRRQS
jgi:uncharacterized membrane protein YgcG